MARTQILVHRLGPKTEFWRRFADGLNQSLGSSVAQANISYDLSGLFVNWMAPLKRVLRGILCVKAGIHICN